MSTDKAAHVNVTRTQIMPLFDVDICCRPIGCAWRVHNILTTVRMNIVVDKSTDYAKPLSVCLMYLKQSQCQLAEQKI